MRTIILIASDVKLEIFLIKYQKLSNACRLKYLAQVQHKLLDLIQKCFLPIKSPKSGWNTKGEYLRRKNTRGKCYRRWIQMRDYTFHIAWGWLTTPCSTFSCVRHNIIYSKTSLFINLKLCGSRWYAMCMQTSAYSCRKYRNTIEYY